MNSPTVALLWEIWRQHRWSVGAIALLTLAGRVVDALEIGRRDGDASPLTVLLAMAAFMLLLGVFNYTESSGDRGLGRFPRRLFTLPVTSLRLVMVPLLAGVASIELLYLLWLDPLSRGGSANTAFVAVLLAALMVLYLCALWTLERFGSLRLIVLGAIVVGLFVVGQLPYFVPTPPPRWRSEIGQAGFVTALSVLAFLMAWHHVTRVRDGDERSVLRIESLFGWMAEATGGQRRAFATPAAAQFWYEWRSSGMVLPALVALQLLILVLPMSMTLRVRSNADQSFLLFLATMAAPMVFAVPVSLAFSKPTFWSEDLAVPSVMAVRPLSSEEFVRVKMKVAAVSTVLTWLVVLVFVAVWLSTWGNADTLSLVALQVWAFHGHSSAAVYGIGVLLVLGGMLITWRFHACRLWSGLSGIRLLLVCSIVSIGVLVIAAMVLDVRRFPRWLLDDPARLEPLAWIAGVAVVAKYWIAAYAWRDVSPRYLRNYLPIWLAGTALFLGLGLVLWNMVRIYVPLDIDRARSVVILLALLAVPLARVGLAPASLTRNRHRS